MKRLFFAVCLALAACDAPANDVEPEGVQVTQQAVTWCLPWIVCPTPPDPPVFFTHCDGTPASHDLGFNDVRVYQEFPPNSHNGWCLYFGPMGSGFGANIHVNFNDNLSTVSLGPDAHVDLYEHINGGGAHIGLNGSPSLRPNVVDLHQLQVNNGPVGWWADRVSSLKTCVRWQTVNGKCPTN